MASRQYTYETTLVFGTDGEPDYAEVDVKVRYTVAWGSPAKGPTYSHGGLPADPPEITDIELVSAYGATSGWSDYEPDAVFAERITDKLFASERDLTAMLEEAAEDDAARQDEAVNRRLEDRAGEF